MQHQRRCRRKSSPRGSTTPGQICSQRCVEGDISLRRCFSQKRPALERAKQGTSIGAGYAASNDEQTTRSQYKQVQEQDIGDRCSRYCTLYSTAAKHKKQIELNSSLGYPPAKAMPRQPYPLANSNENSPFNMCVHFPFLVSRALTRARPSVCTYRNTVLIMR